jgi:hypothetical protein
LGTLEVIDRLKSAHFTTQKSWLPSALTAVKDPVVSVERGLVVDVVKDAAVEEAAGGFLETLTKLTSSPSVEL